MTKFAFWRGSLISSFSHPFATSIWIQQFFIIGCIKVSNKLKITCSFPTCNANYPFFTSRVALAVANNGLLRMTGILMSSSISNTTKSIEIKNLLTLSEIFSRTSFGYFINQSANWKEIVVGLNSPNFSFLQMGKGIKLTLAPRLQGAPSICKLLM